MLATPPIPPQNPPNFDAPKVSAAARVLITKRALMFKSDTPEGVVEEYIRQTGCKFEPGFASGFKRVDCWRSGQHIGYIEYVYEGGDFLVQWRQKHATGTEWKGFSTAILGAALMQIPEEPPFITGTMHGRNKKDNLTDSAAYKSAAQFGYTEIVKNPEDSGNFVFLRVRKPKSSS